jgi:hypothetical protein
MKMFFKTDINGKDTRAQYVEIKIDANDLLKSIQSA